MREGIIRTLLHAFFIISLNIFSMAGGMVIIHLLEADAGNYVQPAIVVVLNLLIYWAVFRFMHGIEPKIMHLPDFSTMGIILLTSLALLPIIFYPLYFFLVKNQWSPLNNLLSIWPYMLILNALCILMNRFLLSAK
jgi:hypothetical protein